MTREDRLRRSRFPLSLFFIFFGILLVMSGIHTGLIVFVNRYVQSSVTASVIPMLYWALVALCLTVFTRVQVVRTYERPVRELAKATEKVAQGDFSVYVPTFHTTEKLDYLDLMILDFNKMVAELGSIETMKTDFVSNVSHEIKTPLTVISNDAQLLKSGRLSETEREECLDGILSNVRRLSDLVMNILKLNKLENQVIKPMVQPYDLCAQLSECVLLYEDVWEKKNIELEFETEDRAIVNADREMMEIVWNNLLSNALKFTPAGGTVRLTQTTEEDAVVVTVSDTGCGMTPETMARIFEKFYQGDTSHATSGNGLGLALARRILQISGGTIAVTSRSGEGSTFTIRLPVRETREA